MKVERLFGFADDVELSLEPPSGLQGLAAAKAALKKDQQEGKLEIAAAEGAPIGKHACTLRARGRFNNVQVETTAGVTISIEGK